MATTITSVGYSHIGHRDENQDRYQIYAEKESGDTLIVVADGMGGHRGGSLAAQTIIDTAGILWKQRQEYPDPISFLKNLASESHAAVNHAGMEQGLTPRSTLAALLIRNDLITSVHVGDSRIIQLSDTEFVKRSIDHSLAQLHVLQGKISEEEMATHPDQNKLTTSIGGEDPPEPEIETWNHAEGMWFVVCSDGFWELFSNQEIHGLLQHKNLKTALENAIKLRLEATEKHDNTTVVVTHLKNRVQANRSAHSLPLIAGAGLAVFLAASYLIFQEAETVISNQPVDDEISTKVTPSSPEQTAPLTNQKQNPVEVPPPDSDATDVEETGEEKIAMPSPKPLDLTPEAMPKERLTPPEIEHKSQIPVETPSQEAPEINPSTGKEVTIPRQSGQKALSEDLKTESPVPNKHKEASRERETVPLSTGDEMFLSNPGFLSTEGEEKTESKEKGPEVPESETLPKEEPPANTPGPLDPVNQETDIPAETGSDAEKAATEELRKSGRIGPKDKVESTGYPAKIGNTRLIRTQQKHQGIPVLGAEIIISQKDGKVIKLHGKSSNKIDIAISPKLTYSAALTIAEKTLAQPVTSLDDGFLAIYKTQTDYRLSWKGTVLIETIPEEVVLDANTAEILLRLPATLDREE